MNILWFKDPGATDLSQAGGKGANLGRLTQSGFVVPPGFIVGTAAYSAHIEGNQGLKKSIASALGSVNYNDPNQLEACVSEIRSKIIAASIPQNVGSDIEKAYKKLGADTYVAVRSSGTAEDLEGASFAGLHDTYLDILGVENVLDAVKRCWASMWTARAVSYRQAQGFDHFNTSIAVVVQTMVESEVSGVLFTGNPINTATDEMLINACWGLGEAVVSGIVTPDEYIVKNPVNTYRDFSDTSNYPEFKPRTIVTDTGIPFKANPLGYLDNDEPRPSKRSHKMRVIDKTLGTKETKIVRDPKTGNGTIHLAASESERAEFTLSEDQVIQLAELGKRIQEAYGGFPQDIEWAYQGGQYYVLQARPITGVDFSWDAEVTASIQGNDDGLEENNVFSRNFPEEMWTGGISPLMFSWRCWGLCTCHSIGWQMDGYPELDYDTRRLWVYHKGLSYHNAAVDRDMIKNCVPTMFREAFLPKCPVSWHDDIKAAPFDWIRYFKFFFRVETMAPHMGFNWWRSIRDDYIEHKERVAEHWRYSLEDMKRLSDNELKQRIWELVVWEVSSYDPPWHGLLSYMREGMNWLFWMIGNWYDGGRPTVMMDIVTGSRTTTITLQDNFAVWELADIIDKSPALKDLFNKYQDSRFMTECEKFREGQEFLVKYRKVVAERGHRGHPDRDIIFDRRADNPMVDIRMIKSLMGSADPRIGEMKTRAKLEETINHVYENIAQKPFGAIKAEAFKLVVDFCHHSLDYRDNERDFMDKSTYAIKKTYDEVGRRCRERGYLEGEKDHYFLTYQELYDVLDGKANLELAKAKIKARSRNFDLVDKKEITPPYYIQNGRGVNLDAPVEMGEGVLVGKTTSLGKVTGTARVVRSLEEIGIVQKGDILVVNSTDPGWTPVFMYISGIVLETGGLISHAALLSREYGLPGVQIPGAINLIPDGATITVDGDAGIVKIHDPEDEPDQEVAV